MNEASLGRMTVNILRANPIEIKWHTGLPIYASEGFLKTVGDEYGWIGGTDNAGLLRCILPYTVIRKPGFRLIRFRVETIPMNGEIEIEEESSFLNNTMEYFRAAGTDMILPSNNTAIFRTYPDRAVAAPYGTFVNDLSLPEEVLFSGVRKTYRNNIRRAMKAGVEIKSGLEYLDISYQLVSDTLRRSGADIIKNCDDFKGGILGLGENVRIFIAEHGGVVQGCLVSPFSEHTAYNWYSGSKSEPVLGAIHLLHWEAIRQFRVMGVKRFNFQGIRIDPEKGSKQEGILNYKKGFGGKLIQGFMWKYSFHRIKSVAYSIAVRVLQGGDIVDREH
jgi:hypothetical protein